MLTTLLHLVFVLAHPAAMPLTADTAAHHACEVAVYAVAGPDLPDDARSWAGEALATLWCRTDLERPFLSTHGR